MYLVRNIFKVRPGKSKAMVDLLKQTDEWLEGQGFSKATILTDLTGEFYTVVAERRIESLDAVDKMVHPKKDSKLENWFKQYRELIVDGRRELWHIEE